MNGQECIATSILLINFLHSILLILFTSNSFLTFWNFFFFLLASPSAPVIVQLHCIHCAMKTLAGPGEELKMDDEVFVTALRSIVKEIPINFERWDIALECLDYCVCKRHEIRCSVVSGFVRLLLLHSSHMKADSVGLALLAMANTVLLRYPRVRAEILAPVSKGKPEDDEVSYTFHSLQFSLFLLLPPPCLCLLAFSLLVLQHLHFYFSYLESILFEVSLTLH
jgi:hypothetical protein